MAARFFETPGAEDRLVAQIESTRRTRAAVAPALSSGLAARTSAIRKQYPTLGTSAVVFAQAGLDASSPEVVAAAQARMRAKAKKSGYSIGQVLKGVARTGLAAIESPLQELQGVIRNVASYGEGGKALAGAGSGAAAGAAIGSIVPGAGTGIGAAVGAGVGALAGILAPDVQGEAKWESQSTAGIAIGQALDPDEKVDLGSGFFVGGSVKAEQIQRSRNVKVGGRSLTPGRFLASAVVEPGTKPFNIASGLLDASVALGPADLGGQALVGIGSANRARKLFAPDPSAIGLVTGARKTVVSERVAEWLDGAAGQKVVDRLAETDSFDRVWKLMGKKVDVKTAVRLADADTPDAVRAILQPELGINIRQKPSMPGVFREQFERRTENIRLLNQMPGSHFDLDRPDQAVEQMDRFMANAKVSPETRSYFNERMARAEGRPEKFQVVVDALDEVGTKLLAEARGERVSDAFAGDLGKAVGKRVFLDRQAGRVKEVDAAGKLVVDFGDAGERTISAGALALRAPAPTDGRTIRSLTTAWKNRYDEMTKYFTGELGENMPVMGAVVGGGDVPTASPHLYNEFINQLIPSPDARQIRRMTSRYGRVLNKPALDLGVASLDFVAQDVWKPLVLLRGAWTVRVVGEEQVRMAASGLDSLVSHPIRAIAWATGRRGGKDLAGRAFDADEDLSDFARSLTTRGGGWRDRIRASGKVNIDKARDPDAYVKGWAGELGQLANDPIAQRVAGGLRAGDVVPGGATGNHVDDVKEWFFSGAGTKLRQEMTEASGGDVLLARTRSAPGSYATDGQILSADDYIDSVFHRIQIKTGEDARLIDAIAAGKIGDKTFRDPAAGDDLRLFLEEGIGPQTVKGDISLVGRDTAAGKAGAALDHAVDSLFSTLMSKPTNYLSRSTAFRQMYYRRVGELIPFMDTTAQRAAIEAAEKAGLGGHDMARLRRGLSHVGGDLTLEDADVVAKGYALDATKKLLYDLTDKNQASDIARIVFPFAEAWKEILVTWAKIGVENPLVVRRAQQTVGAARGAGYFKKDEATGEEMFVYPGSEFLTSKLLGVPTPLQGRVQGLNLFSNGSVLVPGFGPAIQIPAGKLIPHKPQWDAVRELVVPFGEADTSGGFVESFLPAWYQKVRKAMADPESDRVFGNTVADVAKYLVSTGEFDLSSVDGQEQLSRAAVTRARGLYVIRAMAQFVAPSAPTPEFMARDKNGDLLTAQKLAQEFRDLQAVDYESAVEQFLDKYGEDALLYTQPKSRGGFNPTEDLHEWIRSNPELASKYPDVYGYFAPAGGAFSITELDRQLATGERESLTPEEGVRVANARVAAMKYRKAQESVGDAPTAVQKAWLREVREALVDDYPGYEPEKFELGRTEVAIRQLRSAVNDPKVAKTDAGQALAAYMRARDKAVEAAQAAGYAGFGRANAMAPVRAWLRDIADTLTEEHPDFLPLYDRVLEREMKDDEAVSEVA